jgi:hypothetical protein
VALGEQVREQQAREAAEAAAEEPEDRTPPPGEERPEDAPRFAQEARAAADAVEGFGMNYEDEKILNYEDGAREAAARAEQMAAEGNAEGARNARMEAKLFAAQAQNEARSKFGGEPTAEGGRLTPEQAAQLNADMGTPDFSIREAEGQAQQIEQIADLMEKTPPPPPSVPQGGSKEAIAAYWQQVEAKHDAQLDALAQDPMLKTNRQITKRITAMMAEAAQSDPNSALGRMMKATPDNMKLQLKEMTEAVRVKQDNIKAAAALEGGSEEGNKKKANAVRQAAQGYQSSLRDLSKMWEDFMRRLEQAEARAAKSHHSRALEIVKGGTSEGARKAWQKRQRKQAEPEAMTPGREAEFHEFSAIASMSQAERAARRDGPDADIEAEHAREAAGRAMAHTEAAKKGESAEFRAASAKRAKAAADQAHRHAAAAKQAAERSSRTEQRGIRERMMAEAAQEKTMNPADQVRARIDELLKAGTSEGAKKAWQKRERAKKEPDAPEVRAKKPEKPGLSAVREAAKVWSELEDYEMETQAHLITDEQREKNAERGAAAAEKAAEALEQSGTPELRDAAKQLRRAADAFRDGEPGSYGEGMRLLEAGSYDAEQQLEGTPEVRVTDEERMSDMLQGKQPFDALFSDIETTSDEIEQIGDGIKAGKSSVDESLRSSPGDFDTWIADDAKYSDGVRDLREAATEGEQQAKTLADQATKVMAHPLASLIGVKVRDTDLHAMSNAREAMDAADKMLQSAGDSWEDVLGAAESLEAAHATVSDLANRVFEAADDIGLKLATPPSPQEAEKQFEDMLEEVGSFFNTLDAPPPEREDETGRRLTSTRGFESAVERAQGDALEALDQFEAATVVMEHNGQITTQQRAKLGLSLENMRHHVEVLSDRHDRRGMMDATIQDDFYEIQGGNEPSTPIERSRLSRLNRFVETRESRIEGQREALIEKGVAGQPGGLFDAIMPTPLRPGGTVAAPNPETHRTL